MYESEIQETPAQEITKRFFEAKMLASLLLTFLVLATPIASLSLPSTVPPINQQPLLKDDQSNLASHFRDFQAKDIPAVTTLFIEAFRPSATWHYLIPDLEHHYAEVWACYNATFTQAWKTYDRNYTIGKVITVPRSNSITTSKSSSKSKPEDEEDGEIAVSFSVWNIRTPDSPFPSNNNINPFSIPSLLLSLQQTCNPPPGTNTTRAASFTAQTLALDHAYFSSSLYPHQLYLNILATHPLWDGNGFAARHLAWGKQLSRALEPEMPVTLLSSPAGYPLYDGEGFESVKNVTVEMVDGDGELWFEVMRWGWEG